MYRRLVLPLAYVAALTGCVSAPPKGAFVEYREGQTPATVPVKYEATYALCAADQPGAQPLTAHHVAKGERLGFCRDADGSVRAVAPGYSLPLGPGAYSWEVVRGSGPSQAERLWCEVREKSVVAARVTAIAAGIVLLVVIAAGVILIVAFATDKSGSNYT